MELQVADTQSKMDVSDNAFGREFNEALVHQAVNAYLAGGRSISAVGKTRAEVRGGGSKPWRQKGTGRARAGTIRSPLWRGGGLTFGGARRNYRQKLNKKMYRLAMGSIYSELARQNRLIVLEQFSVESVKTKNLLGRLSEFTFDSMLIITHSEDENLRLAARNLHHVEVLPLKRVNPVSLIRFGKVLMTVASVKHVEEWLS
ncbi:MAG: 50S ribosomal protein L4 [Gammaproteobacteria bacterium]|nr:50S ribosomal protein L4 [Gammaproteobacteria bacterium]